MRGDLAPRNGGLDVGEAAAPVKSQRYQLTVGAGADLGLEGPRDHVDAGAEDVFQFGLDASQAEQAHAGRQVGEEVNVAVGPVLPAGDAAEDPQVRHAVGGGGGDQVPAPAADPTAHRP